MNRWLARLIDLFLFVIFPVAAFLGGYRWTEKLFETQKRPYPFEHFGWAVGLGMVFFVWGAGFLLRRSSK